MATTTNNNNNNDNDNNNNDNKNNKVGAPRQPVHAAGDDGLPAALRGVHDGIRDQLRPGYIYIYIYIYFI